VTQKNPEISASLPDQPISFTVHSMPVPDASAPAGPNTVAGRWKMLLVLLVCVAPIVASYFTYYVVRPDGRRNFGDLIDPQRPLPAISGRTLDGQTVQLPSLKGQWLLMAVSGGACDVSCEKNLYFQRQMREALGKEMGRVDRVWFITDDAAVAPGLLPALKGATVLRVAPAALAQWLQPEKGRELQNHLYVVDPIGNWMMRFPPDMDAAAAAKAKRDLDRLLRASGGWDTEGRDAK
jgi:hypothetical protein